MAIRYFVDGIGSGATITREEDDWQGADIGHKTYNAAAKELRKYLEEEERICCDRGKNIPRKVSGVNWRVTANGRFDAIIEGAVDA